MRGCVVYEHIYVIHSVTHKKDRSWVCSDLWDFSWLFLRNSWPQPSNEHCNSKIICVNTETQTKTTNVFTRALNTCCLTIKILCIKEPQFHTWPQDVHHIHNTCYCVSNLTSKQTSLTCAHALSHLVKLPRFVFAGHVLLQVVSGCEGISAVYFSAPVWETWIHDTEYRDNCYKFLTEYPNSHWDKECSPCFVLQNVAEFNINFLCYSVTVTVVQSRLTSNLCT